MRKSNNKEQILARVLKSTIFHKHQLDKDLLSYMVLATEQEKDLNESLIAFEVFGRKDNFDASADPIVRVHMHGLRKKLAAYYMSEGKKDTIQLRIPKGQYAVEFAKLNPLKESFKLIPKPLYLILVLLIISMTFLLYKNLGHSKLVANSQNTKLPNSKVWSEFLQSGTESYFVFGNMFAADEDTEHKNIAEHIMNAETNINPNLSKYPKQKKREDILQTLDIMQFEYPSFCVFDLLPIFYCSEIQPRPLLIEDLTWCKIKDNAIIFLGDFRSLGMMNNFLSQTRYAYHLLPNNQIIYLNENSDTLKTYEPNIVPKAQGDKVNYIIKDYVVVAKISGPTKFPIFIFSSFYGIGIKEAVRYMTSPLSSSQLESKFAEKYGEMPSYFNVLLRVDGVNRTGLEVELLQFDKLDEYTKNRSVIGKDWLPFEEVVHSAHD
jgi:hypothetical protein